MGSPVAQVPSQVDHRLEQMVRLVPFQQRGSLGMALARSIAAVMTSPLVGTERRASAAACPSLPQLQLLGPAARVQTPPETLKIPFVSIRFSLILVQN